MMMMINLISLFSFNTSLFFPVYLYLYDVLPLSCLDYVSQPTIHTLFLLI